MGSGAQPQMRWGMPRTDIWRRPPDSASWSMNTHSNNGGKAMRQIRLIVQEFIDYCSLGGKFPRGA